MELDRLITTGHERLIDVELERLIETRLEWLIQTGIGRLIELGIERLIETGLEQLIELGIERFIETGLERHIKLNISFWPDLLYTKTRSSSTFIYVYFPTKNILKSENRGNYPRAKNVHLDASLYHFTYTIKNSDSFGLFRQELKR